MNFLTPAQLPPPPVFGFSDVKFAEWRPGQSAAIARVLNSTKRIQVECQPPGSGKTLTGMSIAKLEKSRVVLLTRRKGLQDQLLKDFELTTTISDVRGQSAYICAFNPMTHVDTGPCHAGMVCRYRGGGCDYYDALEWARQPQVELIVTNYAFWFTAAKRDMKLGKIDRVICDEAHGVLQDLSNFLSIEIERSEVEALGLPWPAHLAGNQEGWSHWADMVAPAVSDSLEQLKEGDESTTPQQVRQRRRLESLVERLTDLSESKKNWVVDITARSGTLKAAPIWPADYVEKYLFQKVPKILMMSGTIRAKSLYLLGLKDEDFDFNESQSTFPVNRRPFYVLEAPRMSHNMDEGNKALWRDKIDSIIAARQDRRIIIHTGSYDRRNYLLANSRWRNYMIGHAREDLERVIDQFKHTPPPTILVSQSVTEGFDFPYTAAETQIISKFPFPDTQDALTKARTKEDKDYAAYLAMQTIVQAAGRGMRAPDDMCETIIVDGQAKWAMWKYRDFAPKWFTDSVRNVVAIPPPLPKL